MVGPTKVNPYFFSHFLIASEMSVKGGHSRYVARVFTMDFHPTKLHMYVSKLPCSLTIAL